MWSGDRLWFEVMRELTTPRRTSATGDGSRVWDLATGRGGRRSAKAPSLSDATPVRATAWSCGSWKRLEPLRARVARARVRKVRAGPPRHRPHLCSRRTASCSRRSLDDDGATGTVTASVADPGRPPRGRWPGPADRGACGRDEPAARLARRDPRRGALLARSPALLLDRHQDGRVGAARASPRRSTGRPRHAGSPWTAWAGPVFDAPEPPSPMNPRVAVGPRPRHRRGWPGWASWSGGAVSDLEGRDGFESFVAARRQALLRTAYLLTGQHEDAEDLVQVALVKAVPHWKKIAGVAGAVRAQDPGARGDLAGGGGGAGGRCRASTCPRSRGLPTT